MSKLHSIFKKSTNKNSDSEPRQEEKDPSIQVTNNINNFPLLTLERSNSLKDLNTGNIQNYEESYYNLIFEHFMNSLNKATSEEYVKSEFKEENHQNQIPKVKEDEKDDKCLMGFDETRDLDFINGIDSFIDQSQSKTFWCDNFDENEEEDFHMNSFIKLLDGENSLSEYSIGKENNNTYLFGQSKMDKSKIQKDNDETFNRKFAHIFKNPETCRTNKELNDTNKSALKLQQKINQDILKQEDEKINDTSIFKNEPLKKFDLKDYSLFGESSQIFNNENLNNKSTFIKDNTNLRLSFKKDDFFNKKRTRDKEVTYINKESKLTKKLKDSKKLNADKSFKLKTPWKNNELIQEEILTNSNNSLHYNSINNYSCIIPNENHLKLFSVKYCDDNSKENKKKRDEIIKKKRDIVKERIKNEIKLGDIEKYIYREFKEYLKLNRDKFLLYNDFWNAFFAQKSKNEPILIFNKNGEKLEFKSYSHDLRKLLFSINGNVDLYDKFLEDKNFHFNYLKKKGINYSYKKELYRINFHKIYCEKYYVSDLVLEEAEVMASDFIFHSYTGNTRLTLFENENIINPMTTSHQSQQKK